METKVPRFTVTLTDGRKACVRCVERGVFPPRPARVYPGAKRRQQSYCTQCNTEINRVRRQGKVSALLTPAEMDLLRELRTTQPAGRHHAPA